MNEQRTTKHANLRVLSKLPAPFLAAFINNLHNPVVPEMKFGLNWNRTGDGTCFKNQLLMQSRWKQMQLGYTG